MQQFSDQRELVPTESRLPSTIFHAVIVRLGMRYAGFLGFLDDFGLSLSRRCHEGNQGVTNGLLHRVLRRTVEGQSIDDRSHNDAPSK